MVGDPGRDIEMLPRLLVPFLTLLLAPVAMHSHLPEGKWLEAAHG